MRIYENIYMNIQYIKIYTEAKHVLQGHLRQIKIIIYWNGIKSNKTNITLMKMNYCFISKKNKLNA